MTAQTTNSIIWNSEANTLDVDIDNKPLSVVAADFKKATGREMKVPPGVNKTVSLKFKDKPMGEGLSRILSGLNYYTEHGESGSRIVIVDPNGSPPVPTVGRVGAPMMRPPPPPVSAGVRPGFPGGGKSGPSGAMTGGGPNGSADRDRSRRDLERETLELIMREAGMRRDGSRDGGRDGPRPSQGGGSPPTKSRSPR